LLLLPFCLWFPYFFSPSMVSSLWAAGRELFFAYRISFIFSTTSTFFPAEVLSPALFSFFPLFFSTFCESSFWYASFLWFRIFFFLLSPTSSSLTFPRQPLGDSAMISAILFILCPSLLMVPPFLGLFSSGVCVVNPSVLVESSSSPTAFFLVPQYWRMVGFSLPLWFHLFPPTWSFARSLMKPFSSLFLPCPLCPISASEPPFAPVLWVLPFNFSAALFFFSFR